MDLDLETCVMVFLIGFALYLLVNRVFIVEGNTNIPSCNTGACDTSKTKQTCYYEPKCDPERKDYNGGKGCNAGKIDQNCRFCGFGNYVDIKCDSPSSSPSSTPLTPEESQKFKQIINDSVYEPSFLEDIYKDWDALNIGLPFSKFNDVYKSTLFMLNMNNKELQEFLNLLDNNTDKIMNLVEGTNGLIIMINLYKEDYDDYEIDLSYILKIANCFSGDIKLLRVMISDELITSSLELKFNILVNPVTVNDNISSIRNIVQDLPNLQYLDLGGNRISGNLNEFPNLPHLKHLNLSNNDDISGNLNDFPNLPNLQYLNLSSTNISGDISGLSNLRELINLYLCGVYGEPNKKIVGDISKVENIKKIYDNYKMRLRNYTDLDYCPNITKYPFSCKAECLIFNEYQKANGQCEYNDDYGSLTNYNPQKCEGLDENECKLMCLWDRWPPL